MKNNNKLTEDKGMMLTSAQLDIYLDQKRYPSSPNYNIGGVITIKEPICVASFQQAMAQLVAENDVFHLYFQEQMGQPVQCRAEVACKFEYLDFSAASDAKEQAKQFVKTQLTQPFDLSEPGLYQTFLLKLTSDEYWYVPIAHHLVTDGFGYSNWFDTLFRYYLAHKDGNGIVEPIQLTQFEHVVDYMHHNVDISAATADFWQQKFSSQLPDRMFVPKQLNTPLMHESFLSQYAIAQADYTSLSELAKNMGVRIHHLFMAAISCYLNLQYHTSDIILALPFHNRDKATMRAIGGIVSVLPMRFGIDQQWTMADLVSEIRTQMRDVSKFKKYPVSKIVEHARQLKPDLERLFDVQFNYQKLDYKYADGQIDAESEFIPPGVETTPLLFNLCEYGDHQDVILQIEANRAFFDESDVAVIFERLFAILEAIRHNPEQQISGFNFFNEQDFQAYQTLNGSSEACDSSSLVQRFNQQVTDRPNSIALVVGESTWTYRELSEKSAQIAEILTSQGLQSGDCVGLCLDRNENMVATLLACLSIGVTYVPLDPSYPLDRLTFMFTDSQAALLVTDTQVSKTTPIDAKRTLLIDQLTADIEAPRQHSLSFLTEREAVGAYILYTSGSTGRPKGALIAQRSLDNLIGGMVARLELTEACHCLATTTIGFDISTLEIFAPLVVGGKVTLVGHQIGKDALKLAAFANTSEYNLFQCTPTMWQALVEAGWQGNAQATLVTGGEPLYPALAEQMLLRSKRVINGYGPTEATVYSLVEEVHRDKDGIPSCRLSRSLPNYRHFVVDTRGQLAPVGVSGELCIAGDGLALEYIGRPDITATQFVHLPAVANERLYRTGDLVTLHRSGEIEYLGRIDHQVKIRGYRIELGEIEEKLSQLTGIKQAVVTTHGERGSDVKLAAYVIMESSAALDVEAIRTALAAELPNFMVPHFYTEMNAFPLTSSGKVDRKALPEPAHREVEFLAATTDTEHLLSTIWQSLFERDAISVTHNFFELGGHSLLAMKMFGQIRQRLQVDLPLACIFEQPTIRQLASKVDTMLEDQSYSPATRNLTKSDIERGHPLSRSQLSMWVIDKLSYGTAQYNMPGVFSITGALQVSALRNALAQLVSRHEVLRTVLIDDDYTAKQYVLEDYSFDVPLIDLSGKQDVMSSVEHFVEAEANMPFQLDVGLKIRAKIIKTAPEHHFLLLTLHHIAADGWSINILTEELKMLYRSVLRNEAAELPTLDIQYKDYAHWQHQNIQDGLLDAQLEHWLDFLADHPQVHGLPLDYPRPAQPSFEGRSYKLTIDSQMRSQLQAFCQRKDMTPFMVLQLVYALLIAEQSGESDILVGTPVAGRNHPDIEGLIGCFTNSIVLRNRIDFGRPLEDLLAESKQSVMSAFDNQDVPFELLVERLNPERNQSYNPIFQLWFVYHSQQFNPMTLDNLKVELVEPHTPSVNFDLSLSVYEQESTLTLDWEYRPELFNVDTVAQYAARFKAILQWFLEGSDTLIPLTQMSSQNIEVPIVEQGVFAARVVANATASPQSTAVVNEGQTVAQQALFAKVRRMRAYLDAQGVKPGYSVGVCLEHGLALLVTQMACLFSGITFIVLDPDSDTQTIDEAIKRFNLEFAVTQRHLGSFLADTPVKVLDTTEALAFKVPTGFLEPEAKLSIQPICILYPGSDNEIALTQHDLVMLSGKLTNELQPQQSHSNKFIWNASVSFDCSVMALCLMSIGFELHIVDTKTRYSITELNDYLASQQVNLIELTPGYLSLMHSQTGLTFSHTTDLLINGTEVDTHLTEILAQYQATSDAKVIAVNALFEEFRLIKLNQLSASTQHIGSLAQTQSKAIQLRERIIDILHDIYASLLKKDQVKVDAGFYELGGNPLQVQGLCSSCEQHFNLGLNVSTFASGPSVSQLAELISSIFNNQSMASPTMTATTSPQTLRK
ncbi:non-ribosomal peptide synthetase [Pseudoalteromonas sp. OF7H-1]|uniref:non-ribosomal peptide synthetase n=1 Tax=Pseudoalteromonas sp. OF7H-1 TaxID=2917755 RepID=UPI001EF71C4F|nr:non-ribosomal peptide synthetase [Pseudoalteromonas sp. OF7H-1]MCG7540830.1 amino acid adenylation domain-containing protein [Pseudoalteromonas sp. OF7H-1]